MSKKTKLILLTIVCVVSLLIAFKLGVIGSNKTVKGSSVKEASSWNANQIKQLSIKDLFDKKNQFKKSEMIKIISDNKNSPIIRRNLIELYVSRNDININDENTLKNLLKENIPVETKIIIIASSTFNKADTELLKNLINQKNDELTFQSLKALSRFNSQAAYTIAQNILATYTTQSPIKISAAQKAIVKYFEVNKTANKDKFIVLCVNIINNTKDQTLKDSSVFALSDIMDKQAIIEIIKNNSIDKEVKLFSINQNYKILNQMLLGSPSEADIEVVVTAMEILPTKNLVQPLEKVKKNIENKSLLKRYNDVLNIMKTSGHTASTH